MGLFGKAKKSSPNVTTESGIQGLNDTIESLAKREAFLQKKISDQTKLARELVAKKDTKGAKMALKRKKMYEAEVARLEGTQMTMEGQRMQLEAMSTNKMAFDAMQKAAQSMKATTNNIDIDQVDDIRDEIEEQMEIGNTISEAISAPMGSMAEFDDDELDQELELLEEEALDESLLDVAGVDSLDLPSVPSTIPKAKPKQKDEEEDELAALQAAMAM